MTMTAIAAPTRDRTATPLTVLMCRPQHFDVVYAINPWMDPAVPTDTARAVAQWQALADTYARLGFAVHRIDPVDGLPDMVFAANGGFVVDGTAYTAMFAHPQRGPEGPAYARWFRSQGLRVVEATQINEGEGDFLLVGRTVLAGHGFRSDDASHAEVAQVTGLEVVSLRLVRPEYYHLDTALAVLDHRGGREHIAYLPSAFDDASRAELERRYPDAILVSEADAAAFGLNAVSDGLHVVTASRAHAFHAQLREHGYVPVGVDLSELLLGGGGVKCCTLELRGAAQPNIHAEEI
ncbi:dimethylargininase [Demequina sp.]|uniref:dimethylargininase n=1 Tax=Demequina sp. TaxID=2050685 RepID=UPI0025EF6FC6|nr:dimethylargininase [Demequina sp.]